MTEYKREDRIMKKMLIFCSLGNGGTEVALRELLKRIDSSEWQVVLATPKPNGPARKYIPNYVNIIPIAYGNAFSRVQNHLNMQEIPGWKIFVCKVFSKLLSILSGKNRNLSYKYALRYLTFPGQNDFYDLVVDFMGYGGLNTALAASVKARKHVTWIHDRDMWWLKFTKPFFPAFDKVYCVSKAVKDAFVDLCPEYANKAQVFYNFVDEQKIKDLARLPLRDSRFAGKFKILTIGRLMDQKGIDIAIDAAAFIKNSGADIQWYVLGEGSLRHKLEMRIQTRQIDDCFHMLGQVDNPYPYLQECDVYVQPSRSEGYAFSITEAKVLAKPIVASNILPIQEQISTGINGILVPLKAEDFASAVLRYYESSDLREKMSNNLKENGSDTETNSKQMLKELLFI